MKKIVYLGEDTASFHLFFNGASVSNASSNIITFFNLTNFKKSKLPKSAIETIATADHIIFSREIDWKTLKIAQLIAQHGIPYSYYADDNYFILRRIVPSKNVDHFLSLSDTLITTTQAMRNYLQQLTSKPKEKCITVALDVDIGEKSTPRKSLPKEVLNIGFLGTGKNHLYKEVIQDLTENLSNFQLNIYAPSSLCKLLRKKTIAPFINLVEFGFIKNYSTFVRTIKDFNLDFILQPADQNDPNYQFKNLNSLLLPYYCNCLTLFCNSPPYNNIEQHGLKKLLTPSNRFSQTISHLLADNKERITLTEKLFLLVETTFSTNDNIKILQSSLHFNNVQSEALAQNLEALRFRKIERKYHKLRRSIYRKFLAVKSLIQ